jgi:hypothetical protein
LARWIRVPNRQNPTSGSGFQSIGFSIVDQPLTSAVFGGMVDFEAGYLALAIPKSRSAGGLGKKAGREIEG